MRKWEEKSLVWTTQIIFTYHMNSRLIKLRLKSNTCEIINFPVIVPCLLQISSEVPFAVIINPSQWHCQSFLICHLLLVSAKLESQMSVLSVMLPRVCKKSFLVWRTILIYKFSIRLQKNTTTGNITPFHVINFNKQFDFRTHHLRGPPGY